ncbi:hypothetical protein EUBDOL_01865 [Amedibacillus dolichus DSM 3991]|uniref:Uncharacterized protein n=1 Tax=Amedibacillus dolichus DSM 3991 TaxID=428127 RepID=A8RD95_9FIRM|nr:hypothetical protein EUBDOL_01865 [Amedibacillus dolichus DSM 3991]
MCNSGGDSIVWTEEVSFFVFPKGLLNLFSFKKAYIGHIRRKCHV